LDADGRLAFQELSHTQAMEAALAAQHQKHQKELKDMREAMEAALAAQHQKHQKELKDMREAMEAALAAQHQKHQKELKDMREGLNESVSRWAGPLQEKHEAELARLQHLLHGAKEDATNEVNHALGGGRLRVRERCSVSEFRRARDCRVGSGVFEWDVTCMCSLHICSQQCQPEPPLCSHAPLGVQLVRRLAGVRPSGCLTPMRWRSSTQSGWSRWRGWPASSPRKRSGCARKVCTASTSSASCSAA
jgi:hypothetical protein